ncbi:MAG TPA: hypothetical protein ENJ35_11365 [Gammaproteobacteria bacterium]|nr:hypothetical protein [Gammaproteobacteria bacterium]
MSTLRIPIFHGIAPRKAARKLAQSQSQVANNCELFSEELRPIKNVIEINSPAKAGIKKGIYLLGSTWLHWLTDVDVARSPLYLENELRIHYTGDYNPKSTDNTLATASPGAEYPTDFYRLGLPRPDTAPVVTHTGGTGNSIDRSYVYTFVTAWGEEGPPSPVGSHTGAIDAANWSLTGIDASPPNTFTVTGMVVNATSVDITFSANHFMESTEYLKIAGTILGTGTLPTLIIGVWQVTRLTTTSVRIQLTTTGSWGSGGIFTREAPIQTASMIKRVYRTLAGDYRYVGETTGTTFADSVADEDLGGDLPGGILEKNWWKAPNGDMKGLISFPGGVQVGFYGNTLSFCEPNVPSAYPDDYKYTFNNDIVAIGVVGNTVVVATKGYPAVVTGTHPGSMSPGDLEIFQACVSKRGMVSMFNGVLYPSEDGLVYVPSVGVPSIITSDFFKQKDWAKFNPSSLVSAPFDDRYYGFYENGGENGDETGAIVFDPKEPGATFTTLGMAATALHSDLESDELFLMQDTVISQYDVGGSFLTYTWLSKLFTTGMPIYFNAAKVKITLGKGVTSSDKLAAIAAAISALETDLTTTGLNTSFGSSNNYDSGSLGGSSVGYYTLSGGPYAAAVSQIGAPIVAIMNLYAWFDDGSGSIERHLFHTENLSGSKVFRLGNITRGFLADQWEVEFNCSDVIVHDVIIGTDAREIAKS